MALRLSFVRWTLEALAEQQRAAEEAEEAKLKAASVRLTLTRNFAQTSPVWYFMTLWGVWFQRQDS